MASPSPTSPGFIDQLVDWRAFEHFVRDMFSEDTNLVVEHDVMDVGKSGAKRQTDVKLTHRVGAMTYVTLVECKRWKEKVSRDRIDVLVASVNDLRAAKGVMFTTSGFETGAEQYASDHGVELFIVRDLTDDEWGLPGRVVSFWMRMFAANFGQINMHQPQMIPTVEQHPTTINIVTNFDKDQSLDPELVLHSVIDGEPGPNLATLCSKRVAGRWSCSRATRTPCRPWDRQTSGCSCPSNSTSRTSPPASWSVSTG